MSEAYWNRLKESVAFIEGLYKKHKIILPPNEGLQTAINEAKAQIAGTKMAGDPTDAEVAATAEKTNVIIT
ncbi:MAG: hypothetical protein JKY27_01175, partial [Magnetovibrio sp.]|nr:hypothetical protein [Magnetovibrio sp.]